MDGVKRFFISLIVLAVLIFSALACGSATETQDESSEPPEQEVSNQQDAPTEESKPTDTPEPTPIPPSPTPSLLGLSRSNPYPEGELVSAPNWDVQVVEVVRGEDAWTAIQAANMFNDPPPDGMEYILVKIHVKCTYADDETHSISDCDFDMTGDRFTKYTCSTSSVVAPEPALDAELYTDGETEGWAGYLVGKDEGNLILIVDEMWSFLEDNMRFIALDEGAAINVPAELMDIEPTDFGKERSNPASLADTVITEDWTLEIVEVKRGDEAWAMVEEVNQFNDPPAEGMEYIAVKLHVRYIGTEDKSETIDYLSFQTTGSAGVLYDIPSVVDPEPALDVSLFPGGEAEGWVVVQAAVGETDVMLVFEPPFEFSDENVRFISLE